MIQLDGESVTLESVWTVATTLEPVRLSTSAEEKMRRSRRFIEEKIEKGETMYGVNTGFGPFSDVKISREEILQLQKNFLRSHSSGIGAVFSKEQTRAMMYLRANALATGYSGVRVELVQKILELLNKDLIPVVPQQGSVGASGDLAPLSHMALPLIGEGEIWEGDSIQPAADVLKKHKIETIELQAKEGLSLANGCQVMTAVGMLNCFDVQRMLKLADVAGAMSTEALQASRKAFDVLITRVRPHPGEVKTAANLRKLLGETSEIGDAHKNCGRVQDSYSIRCMPAVHGAAKDTYLNTLRVLEREANSSTDNPLVFEKEGKILSCGNFHGEPVAFSLDFLAIAVAEIANISERRLEKMINPASSGLPAFLTPKGGLNSGLMIVQYAAAALVSENKVLCHPASVDSIPTSANKEDHVSMGTIASRKLTQIVRNAENVIAMEFLGACQALDMLKPLKPSSPLYKAYELIRERVPYAAEDRQFSKDIRAVNQLLAEPEFLEEIEKIAGALEL